MTIEKLPLHPALDSGAPSERRFSVICLSPSAWEVDLPTNRQQIMRRVAERGHRVRFVETVPFLGRHLLALLRGTGRRRPLLAELLTGREAGPCVTVLKAPNVLPGGHKYRFASAVNGFLTRLLVARVARRKLQQPVVPWIYDPCFAAVVGRCGDEFSVYDCIDDYTALSFYGPRERALVVAGDRLAAARSRVVFATTNALYERHRGANSNTHLVRNVGDYRHFAPAADPAFAAPEIQLLSGPVIGFVGRFMTGKIDFDVLDAVARADERWSIALVGPADAEAADALARLTAHPNVLWFGPKAYGDVPRYVAGFDVGLCPYVWNDWMRSGFPLKLYEYLAAGKPVVASGNPDLAGMEPDVVLARGAEAFVAAVRAALGLRSDADRGRRVAIAAQNTWEIRTERLLSLVGSELEPVDGSVRAVGR